MFLWAIGFDLLVAKFGSEELVIVLSEMHKLAHQSY